MNTGHKWTETELADLMSLGKTEFLAKYEDISPTAYRQRKSVQERRAPVSPTIPVGDGTYKPATWTYRPRQARVPAGIERHVMVNDTHGVFVEQAVWAAVLDFIRDFKPTHVHLLGDIADFYDISRFSKDPTRRVMLVKEIDFTRDVVLAEVRRAAPLAEIDWVEGNHENRLQRYLWAQAPQLAGLPGLEIPELFQTDKFKIRYTTGNIQVGALELTHGHLVRRWSGYTAKAMLEEYGKSVIHGHTHRLGAVYKTDRSGEYVAYENGCLCQTDLEYVDGVANWQHGFSVGWVLPSGRFHVQQIAIVDGKFVYGGKLYGE